MFKIELSLIEYLQGMFSLLFVSVFLIVGTIILLKYFKLKRQDFLFVGIAWIGIVSPWWGDAINMLLILFFDTILEEMVYLIIVVAIAPIPLMCWLIAFTDLVYPHMRKLILIAFLIFSITIEILFFSFLFANPTNIATFKSPFQVQYNEFIQIYFLIILIIFILTGLLFSRETLKSENPELKLKGKLLFLAFIVLAIGSVLDAFIPLTPITVVITRVILSSSAIFFYFGFILPKAIKNFFLKEI